MDTVECVQLHSSPHGSLKCNLCLFSRLNSHAIKHFWLQHFPWVLFSYLFIRELSLSEMWLIIEHGICLATEPKIKSIKNQICSSLNDWKMITVIKESGMWRKCWNDLLELMLTTHKAGFLVCYERLLLHNLTHRVKFGNIYILFNCFQYFLCFSFCC